MKILKVKNSNRDKVCVGWLIGRIDVAKEIISTLEDRSK